MGWRGLLRRGLARRAVLLAWLFAVAVLPSLLVAYTAVPVPWPLSLAVHFQWVILAGGTLCGVLAVWGGTWRHVRIPFIVSLLGWVPQSAQVDWDRSIDGEPRPTLSLATANLNYETTDFSRLQRWLTSAEAPDVVVLQEFTESAKAAVRQPGVIRAYPYRALAPQPDQFGLAILSRLPLLAAERVEPAAETATLALRSTINWQGREVSLSALHPMPPISGLYEAARDEAIQQEARRLGLSGLPALLAGDLNDTPWSTGLRGAAPYMARAGFPKPTWPNVGGWLSVLPLDHVLATTALDREGTRQGARPWIRSSPGRRGAEAQGN